jgi:hypothetical protein
VLAVASFAARYRFPPFLCGPHFFEINPLNPLNVEYRKVDALISYASNPIK